jgi:hypothetical protein
LNHCLNSNWALEIPRAGVKGNISDHARRRQQHELES